MTKVQITPGLDDKGCVGSDEIGVDISAVFGEISKTAPKKYICQNSENCYQGFEYFTANRRLLLSL